MTPSLPHHPDPTSHHPDPTSQHYDPTSQHPNPTSTSPHDPFPSPPASQPSKTPIPTKFGHNTAQQFFVCVVNPCPRMVVRVATGKPDSFFPGPIYIYPFESWTRDLDGKATGFRKLYTIFHNWIRFFQSLSKDSDSSKEI
ncbi:hypothetical protein Pcinc_042088 [Petrolisthes cinctipes]|uniref:Uncharacterized protein n=1 Tax=Petrolisthes cinctipes TaxID=88211 RepID=A0AAE1EGB0_PETCI|nr:hypothetical protein Pcinc_042088 [Petrolisthes cinctipes]